MKPSNADKGGTDRRRNADSLPLTPIEAAESQSGQSGAIADAFALPRRLYLLQTKSYAYITVSGGMSEGRVLQFYDDMVQNDRAAAHACRWVPL